MKIDTGATESCFIAPIERQKVIKTVLLDLDDTLFDFHRAEHSAIEKTFREIGIEPTDEVISLYSRINQTQWERLERREIDRDRVRLGRFELLFEALGVTGDPKATQKSYENNLSSFHYYIDGAVELLEAIYQKYELYIVSNGTWSVQKRRIADSGIEKYFKGIFVSEMVGHNKPSPEYFYHCFERIEGFQKESAIIVGDSISSDIKGGRAVGIKTCLFNPKKKRVDEGVSDYEIHALAELIPLLEAL